jgi:hypothetical protein
MRAVGILVQGEEGGNEKKSLHNFGFLSFQIAKKYPAC